MSLRDAICFCILAEGEICKKRDMSLRDEKREFISYRTRTQASVYRICEANISHRRKAIYRSKHDCALN